MHKAFLHFVCLIALALIALAGAGCASTYDNDSDLPWNAPQPWESAPSIPGLNER